MSEKKVLTKEEIQSLKDLKVKFDHCWDRDWETLNYLLKLRFLLII